MKQEHIHKAPKVLALVDFSRTHGRDLMRGIVKYSTLCGHWRLSKPSPSYRTGVNKSRDLLNIIKKSDADGVILQNPDIGATEIDEIIKMGLPSIVTTLNEELIQDNPFLIGLSCNNRKIGDAAAEYLLERAFRHFAYCGFDNMFWSIERGEGFDKYVKKAGYQVHFYSQRKTHFRSSWEKELPFVVNWLRTLPHPIGLMACNDDRAQNVVEACGIADLKIPDEVAVIGADNDDLICNTSYPSISSIALNFTQTGYDAARLLDKIMAGKKEKERLLYIQPWHIVTRQSTDILMIDNKIIVDAIHFIQQNVKKPIQVSNIAEALLMSRRALERLFRSVVGCSVNEEIRRYRIEYICKLLMDTDLNISEIAHESGFQSTDHISRYFRRHTKMNPSAYRKLGGSRKHDDKESILLLDSEKDGHISLKQSAPADQ